MLHTGPQQGAADSSQVMTAQQETALRTEEVTAAGSSVAISPMLSLSPTPSVNASASCKSAATTMVQQENWSVSSNTRDSLSAMTEQIKTLTLPVGAENTLDQDGVGMTQTMLIMQMQMQMCKMNQRMMEMVEESDCKHSSTQTPSPPHCWLVLDMDSPKLSAQDMADFEEWKQERARQRERKQAAHVCDRQGGEGV
jgi:hypothetical protein